MARGGLRSPHTTRVRASPSGIGSAAGAALCARAHASGGGFAFSDRALRLRLRRSRLARLPRRGHIRARLPAPFWVLWGNGAGPGAARGRRARCGAGLWKSGCGRDRASRDRRRVGCGGGGCGRSRRGYKVGGRVGLNPTLRARRRHRREERTTSSPVPLEAGFAWRDVGRRWSCRHPLRVPPPLLPDGHDDDNAAPHAPPLGEVRVPLWRGRPCMTAELVRQPPPPPLQPPPPPAGDARRVVVRHRLRVRPKWGFELQGGLQCVEFELRERGAGFELRASRARCELRAAGATAGRGAGP